MSLRVSREHQREGLDISRHGQALQWAVPLLNYLPAARRVSNIVSAACLCSYFEQMRPRFERDVIAHCGAIRAKRENTRFHSPLGNAADLARHLILGAWLCPRSELLPRGEPVEKRPATSGPGLKRG